MNAWTRRLKLTLLLLAAILFAGFIGVRLLKPRPNPQLYSGKTIHEWVLLLDPDVNKQAQNEQAAYEISKIGAPVLPEIERILKRRPNSPLEKARSQAARWHLVQPDQVNLPHQHFRATRAAYNIAEYGNVDISPLIPLITYDFTNTNYFTHGEEPRALAAAGPAGVAVLTNLLVKGTPEVRDQSAYGLHYVLNKRNRKEEWPAVFDALARATADSNQSVRVTAALGLQRAPTNVEFPIALRFLNSTNGYERWAGADILSGMNLNEELRNALQKALDDPEQRVQDAARRALQFSATNNPVRQ